MSSTKCHACGVINFAHSQTCRRCGSELRIETVAGPPSSIPGAHAVAIQEGRGFGHWVLWSLGVTATILFSVSASVADTYGFDPVSAS